MVNFNKKAVIPLMLTVLLLLVSCGAGDFTFDVLAVGEGGAEITGESLKQAEYGGEVQFTLTLPAGESLVQVFADDVLTTDYTYQNGTVTLKNITAPHTYRFVAGIPGEQMYWGFALNDDNCGFITTNVDGVSVAKGSMVTLNIIPKEGAVFLGWTMGVPIEKNAEIISTDEQVTVEITDHVYVFANFDGSGMVKEEEMPEMPDKDEDILTIYYNNNGGDIMEGGKVAVETVFENSYWTMPYGREDDGTLTREGYVLLGYSPAPELEGELIRPGYKYDVPVEDDKFMMYCIWQQETNAADFTVADDGTDKVKITAYNGSDEVIYIPRIIDGKTVTRIADGAFAGNTAIREVHVTPSVLYVEENAFADCANLTTVTLYDNLKQLSDESFSGSPVQTVRLCAAKTPRYTTSFETFGIKYERLMHTMGEERIIIVAGSSAVFGIDSDYMESLFQNDYTVINYGTNANMNIVFYLDAILPHLTEKDTVIFAPEQYGPFAYHTNGNPQLPAVTLQGISTSYNLFENIDVSDYTEVFDGIGQYCNESYKMPEANWDDHNMYVDIYGDHDWLSGALNSENFRYGANGEFRFNETVIPEEFIPNLNRVIDEAVDTGATILFSFPPVNRNNIEKESLDSESYDYYNQWIADTVHCRLISDVRDFIYNGKYFANTDYHLNAVGRELHTTQVAKDIIAADVGIR